MAISPPTRVYDAVIPPDYEAPPPTTKSLEYADLAVIDLSKGDSPEARTNLAAQVSRAMRAHGFFYAINHGYTSEQTNQIFSLANLTFDGVSEKEKEYYMSESNTVYEGYKPRKTWLIESGIQDQIEHYNMNRHLHKRSHPDALRPFLPLMDNFARHNHYNIVHPILRLLALGLELPEDALVSQHKYDAQGHTSVRFMKYHPRSADEEVKTRNVWLKGHTDFGSITILWSQPVSGLQILSLDGKWRWVRHIENALVVNAGDALGFLCGGFYPPTRHRVVQPPPDQRNIPRLGVFYFVMPDDDTKLVPHEESPVLQKIGMSRICDTKDAPTMEEWRRGRTVSYGTVALKAGVEKGVEEELVRGVVVKHYN